MIEFISDINIEIIIESLKSFFNFVLPIIWSVVGIIGVFFMFKIIDASQKIEKIDSVIIEEQEKLHKIEIEQIENSNSFYLDHRSEDCKKKKIEQKIERLETKRRSLLDQISIYKIFKNN